jgi:hypothetical protein
MITIDYDTEQQLYKLAQEEGTEPEKLIKKLLSLYLGEEPDATQELLDIPHFQENFTRGCEQIAQNKTVAWDALKRKY